MALFIRLSVCGSIYVYYCRALLVTCCTRLPMRITLHNNESQVETENDGSHDIEQATLPHPEETEQSELPDIVSLMQNITHCRKHTQNDTDSNLLNKK